MRSSLLVGNRRLSIVAAIAAVDLPSSPAPALHSKPHNPARRRATSRHWRRAASARRMREIKYGDWQKFCFKTPGTNTVCRTTISGTWDTGQSAVRVDLIEREGEGNARLQLFLPVGLYLQAGVKLTVDQGKPYQIPYVWCMTNTCIAGSVADPQLSPEIWRGARNSAGNCRFQCAERQHHAAARSVCHRAQGRANPEIPAGCR